MAAKFSLEEIRAFWTRRALEHGQASEASWSDQMAMELEVREVLKHLQDDEHVLDAGCGNGHATVQFAASKRGYIRGLDYIPELIEQARCRLGELAHELVGKVEFDVGDITALDEPTEAYDKVVIIRVLISLGEWGRQLRALRECTRVLKRGGVLLLSEATYQGWHQLNKFRREWGLPDIPMKPFNEYLDQERVIEAVAPQLELVEIANFASTYYVGTRVLKPLLVQALGSGIDAATPNMEWNRWFAQLPAWGDYGTQKLFVLRKV